MKTYIVIGILVILFIYMVVWSLKLYFYDKRQKKVKRIQELRAKGNESKQEPVDETKDYWYNLREVNAVDQAGEAEKYYNYFDSVEEGVKGLLLEMYDCGVVRTDELAKVAYGKDPLQNSDLSFLEDLDKESANDDSFVQEVSNADDIIQIEGMMGGGFFAKSTPDVVTAAKELKEDDPGITDIHGTLSEGVENVLAAVEAEKKQEEAKNEPIIVKEEKSVEEARKAREMTATSEIRNQVYNKWIGYVDELYELVHIHSDEATKNKIHKALTDYGYNDVDVLLESPE